MTELDQKIDECRKILLELKRIDETGGNYNHYNRVRPAIVEIVDRVHFVLSEFIKSKIKAEESS